MLTSLKKQQFFGLFSICQHTTAIQNRPDKACIIDHQKGCLKQIDSFQICPTFRCGTLEDICK